VKLWLLRHARALVDSGVCYGALDVAADEAATQAAAQKASDALPDGLPVWHSPLQRCEHLAQVLQGLRPDFALEVEPRLREMNFGAWEGKPWDAIPRQEMDAWVADFGYYRVGGAECTQAVLARTAQALADFQRALQAAGRGEGVWITHAGVIRCVALLVRGVERIERADQWPGEVIAFGSLQAVDLPPL
jgi:alpha-ribazole phosphatase